MNKEMELLRIFRVAAESSSFRGGCQDFRVQGWLSNYTEGRMNRSA
jgi:hypothetical protein